jgi:hypothetical protein
MGFMGMIMNFVGFIWYLNGIYMGFYGNDHEGNSGGI